MTGPTNMVLRTNVRHDVALRARVRVVAEQSRTVRLSAGAASGDGWIELDLVDISAGGLGLMSTLFLPRGCRLEVVVAGVGGGEELLNVRARVQRVLMTDRRPGYLIGTVFDGENSGTNRGVEAVLAALSGESAA